MRVPRMTGLPTRILGSMMMRSSSGSGMDALLLDGILHSSGEGVDEKVMHALSIRQPYAELRKAGASAVTSLLLPSALRLRLEVNSASKTPERIRLSSCPAASPAP